MTYYRAIIGTVALQAFASSDGIKIGNKKGVHPRIGVKDAFVFSGYSWTAHLSAEGGRCQCISTCRRWQIYRRM